MKVYDKAHAIIVFLKTFRDKMILKVACRFCKGHIRFRDMAECFACPFCEMKKAGCRLCILYFSAKLAVAS